LASEIHLWYFTVLCHFQEQDAFFNCKRHSTALLSGVDSVLNNGNASKDGHFCPGIDSASLCSLARHYNPICRILTRQASKARGIDSSESIPGLLKRLQVRTLKALHVADFLTDRPMAQEKAVGSGLVLISKLVDSS
jgi:hypothetical protein